VESVKPTAETSPSPEGSAPSPGETQGAEGTESTERTSSEEDAPTESAIPTSETPSQDTPDEDEPESSPDPSAPEDNTEAVDWFKDAVFVGDSITVRLESYASATGALGEAQFLCATSMSAVTALSPVTETSYHPSYHGTKVKVEDGVAACGAKNVYIMLGINNMRADVSDSIANLTTLIDNILAQSPDVNFILQSVMPMTRTSNIVTEKMNNTKIQQYNAQLQALCEENGWHYLDVASQLMDEDGYLIQDYCSDANDMGIHLNSAGTEVWANYLTTHIPEGLM